jgi:hypothetical protein
MKKMKNYNHFEDSTLYKKNIKIHSNLWKVYTLSLLVGILVISLKGLS